VSTNRVDRSSRLFRSIPEYLKHSVITITRMYSMFNPFKLFTTLGSAFIFGGFLIGCRLLCFYILFRGAGKIQSLILAAVLFICGFQFEDALLRIKKIELSGTAPSAK